MPARIAILHGWSDTSKSFHALRTFLDRNGHSSAEIRLGNYISLEDDVRIEDVATRLNEVINAAMAAGEFQAEFDLIVHSTGALVAREWIARYYSDGEKCPVKRLIMLAPANFGSRLAHLGKSMIGRVAKGWKSGFQTGTEMLTGLELASTYQWNLARRDLFGRPGDTVGPYGADKVWPFVITGSRGYRSTLRQIVNENGSDGTVRAAAANLNAYGLTIDFSKDAKNPGFSKWLQRCDIDFPFALLPDRDHTSICRPEEETSSDPEVSGRLGKLILQALACKDADQYAAIEAAWREISDATGAMGSDLDGGRAKREELNKALRGGGVSGEELHQYMQIVAHVRDDQGHPVDDYFLEFSVPDRAVERLIVFFHSNVLEHVHTNSQAGSRRCFFIDRTDLVEAFYAQIGRLKAQPALGVTIVAAALGNNIQYFDTKGERAAGYVVVHHEQLQQRERLDGRLHHNATHLIEIVVPRKPVEKVFLFETP